MVGMACANVAWAVRSTQNACLREAQGPEIPKKTETVKEECPTSEK